jgi:uncharacterized protein (DUF1919 family)
MKLTPADEAQYRYLKQQVDYWMERQLRVDPEPTAKQKYFYAKDELTDFVSIKRREGYNI